MTYKFFVSIALVFGVFGIALADENCTCANDAKHKDTQWSVYWENDSIPGILGASHSDRWYTNGAKVVYSYEPSTAYAPTKWMQNSASGVASNFFGNATRQGVVFGQLMYTPQNIAISAPQPNDRFYGGWLYFGGVMQNEDAEGKSDHTRTAELDVGVVGPYSYAGQVQKFVHGQLLHVTQPAGWDYQIRGEPGIQFSLNDITRGPHTSYADASYYGGVVVGTVFDNIKGGLMLRLGKNLDNVPVSVIESPVISAPLKDRGFYTLFRAEVQAVAHNTFIDGSFFRAVPFQTNIKSKPFVGQATLGFVWEGRDEKISLLLNRRTAEFTSPTWPNGAMFTYGTINVEWAI